MTHEAHHFHRRTQIYRTNLQSRQNIVELCRRHFAELRPFHRDAVHGVIDATLRCDRLKQEHKATTLTATTK